MTNPVTLNDLNKGIKYLDSIIHHTLSLETIINNYSNIKTTSSLNICNLCIENINTDVGLDIKPLALGKNEIAIENLWYNLIKAWEYVAKGIKWVFNKFIDFIMTIFSKNRQLRIYLEEMEKKLEKTKHLYMRNATIDSIDINKGFGFKGKCNADVVIKLLITQADETKYSSTKAKLMTKEIIKYISEYESKLLTDTFDINGSSALLDKINEELKKIFHDRHLKQLINGEVLDLGPFINGKGIRIHINNVKYNPVEISKITIVDNGTITKSEIPTLTTQQMKYILGFTKNLLDANVSIDTKEIKIIKDSLDRTISNTIKTIKTKAKKEVYKPIEKQLDYTRKIMLNIFKTIIEIEATLPSYNIKACRLALNYVDESLKQYRDKP